VLGWLFLPTGVVLAGTGTVLYVRRRRQLARTGGAVTSADR
jgi:N-acetylglucosamine kinase-like BadF-type ATPase